MKLVDAGSQNVTQQPDIESTGKKGKAPRPLPPTRVPKPKSARPPKPEKTGGTDWKTKLLIGGICIVGLIAAIFLKSVLTDPVEKPVAPVEQEQENTVHETTVLPEQQTNEETALTHLERSNAPLTETAEAKESLQAGIDQLVALAGAPFVRGDNHEFSLTSEEQAGYIQALLADGYAVEVNASKWFESNNEDVWQFVFRMTKADEPDVVFSGNYLFGERILSVVAITDIHGVMHTIDTTPATNTEPVEVTEDETEKEVE